MYIYFYWTAQSHQQIQAFHKADKAAEYVINQIEALIGNNKPKPYKKKDSSIFAIDYGINPAPPPINMFVNNNPPIDQQPIAIAMDLYNAAEKVKRNPKTKEKDISDEFTALKSHLDIAKKYMTFENAVKAVELYEEYARYGLQNEAYIHTLQDLKIVE